MGGFLLFFGEWKASKTFLVCSPAKKRFVDGIENSQYQYNNRNPFHNLQKKYGRRFSRESRI